MLEKKQATNRRKTLVASLTRRIPKQELVLISPKIDSISIGSLFKQNMSL